MTPGDQPRLAKRVVAIGGGRGLATSLRSLRQLSSDVKAIVSVADDGGSSGRLRHDTDRAAPGDIRKCIQALADNDSLFSRSLDFRFDDNELRGHALGNLVLAALADASGSLITATAEVARLVGIVGEVIPVTADPVQLMATTISGEHLCGQVAIMATKGLDRVWLERSPCGAGMGTSQIEVNPAAVSAIDAADVVVLGPGSLYTSVLAAAMVNGVHEALVTHAEKVVYVCNVATQSGETQSYSVSDHIQALRRHGIVPGRVLFDETALELGGSIPNGVAASLMAPDGITHDVARLAVALSGLVA